MDPSVTSDKKSCSACGAGWQFPLLLGLVLAGILLARSGGIRDDEEALVDQAGNAGEGAAAANTVFLTIDFGDGQLQRFDDVPWHEGMTIEQLLGAVSQMPNAPEFAKQGSGPAALLTRIGDRENEGADGSNWTYLVNGQRGDRSFGVFEVEPGDRVLWKFGPQE